MSELDSVCVLANRSLLEWQATALERMVEETGVDIPLVVVNEVTDVDHPGFSEGASPLGEQATSNATGVGVDDLRLFYHVLKREGLWAFVLSERKLAWLLGIDDPGRSQRRPLDDVAVLDDAERVRCEPVPVEGSWCDLPDDVVDRVATETDVAVRFGFSLLTGSILSEPAHGVLSFHPADIRRYRGLGPPQPFASGDQTAGATLQQLTDELDGGNVVAIETIDVGDAHTLDEIYERVHERQSRMLARGIERLRDPAFEPEPPASLGQYTPVTKRQEPAFAGKVLAKNLLGRVRHERD
ncbi:formyltransferase family protein [Haloarcula onubensis]|uniref:Methionyl-tRNA formyltransferase-like protein n=1 Tax=Haloarcula onubensis TaxID=2950539 RepID=A0ABU2FKV8_9EURY|nr:formyltransferase family protein [Halomicroarcula sp. S3CR25-11]MDS0281363.1 methionyl-tRNA formyltransferase-like protein [Halomicroarcula sp. S3CR25-11]